jgi:dipeptidase E
MKLLLTSSGLSNDSIKKAFIDLVGKPAEDIKVCFIITASLASEGPKDWLIKDLNRIYELGGYLDIIDISLMDEAEWRARLEPCDVIFVGGGNTFYLSYCMQKSGLFAAIPELLKTKVYAGISAGSMIASQSIALASQALKNPQAFYDEQYDDLGPKGKSAGQALKLVDFIFRPHFNAPKFPLVNEEFMEKRAKEFTETIYALDDDSALKIVDDEITVISEGEWKLFKPGAEK